MIAIAGAKGGSGKTTTTLGLAAAFARSGIETLAVDADRQLPDLHVTAGVEREPTVAALDRETSWHSLAQEFPGTSGAHVLPGQKPTENVELDAALEWLNAGATEVLLDCPSGAGPDVVEAIALADGVVVVTTDSDQSLDAAATTIDIARRLDVPVAGAVFTHCSAVPEAFHSRFEIPVLAVVPESDSPLASEEARTEYDRAAEELASLTATRPADPEPVDSAATGPEPGDWVTPDAADDGQPAEADHDGQDTGDPFDSTGAETGTEHADAADRVDAGGPQSSADDAQSPARDAPPRATVSRPEPTAVRRRSVATRSRPRRRHLPTRSTTGDRRPRPG
ncbi:AAA family ATPase [Halosimplex aquaticum]